MTEENDEYIFIQATELLEIATNLYKDFYKPHKTDAAGWITLLNKVRKTTGKNYRLNPNDWGLDELEDAPRS